MKTEIIKNELHIFPENDEEEFICKYINGLERDKVELIFSRIRKKGSLIIHNVINDWSEE